MPTVCGLCPVGCNVTATTREGKVKRILSRNHPEVDEGWLCDKGRFAFTHLYADDRITDPLRRSAQRGFEELSWDDALDEAERLLRESGGRIVTALSGSETVEQAYALGTARCAAGSARTRASCCRRRRARALDAFRAPLSSIRDAELVVVARRRAGRRARAGRRPLDQGRPPRGRRGASHRRRGTTSCTASRRRSDDELGGRLRESERAILIWSGAGRRRRRAPSRPSRGSSASRQARLGAFYLPRDAERPRRRRRLGRAPATAKPSAPGADRPADRLRRRGRRRPGRPRARRARRARARDHDVPEPGRAAGPTSSCPGTSYLERDGTYVNLEGRLQRLRRTVIPPAPDELAWIAKLAERFGVELSPYPSRGLRRAVRADATTASRSATSASGPRCAPAARRRRPSCPSRRPRARARACAWSATGRSSPARPSSACRSSSSSGREPRGRALARRRRARARSRPATTVARPLERHLASSCARASTRALRRRRRPRRRGARRRPADGPWR